MRKIYLLTHPLFIAFILFSLCNDDGIFDPGGDTTIMLGDTVYVDYGKTLHNFKEQIWITFDSLYEDSRCPLDVVCVWEGNAKLGFTFRHENQKARIVLNTYPGFNQDTTVFRYRITLTGVLPHPYSDSTYSAEDYSARIVVDRK